MKNPPTSSLVPSRRGTIRSWIVVPLLLCMGCQTPKARPTSGPPRAHDSSRARMLARQVLTDTALESATHPVRTTAEVLAGSVSCVHLTSRELIAKRLLLPFSSRPEAPAEDRPSLDSSHLERVLARMTSQPLEDAHVEMDISGEQAFHRLEHLIDSAQHSIDVLVYLWDSDSLGWSLARRLAERARSLPCIDGVPPVRVMIDGGGNLIHGPAELTTGKSVNELFSWLGAQPNVEVLRTRNPLASFDHRKLVVIDGDVAWTGGRNFTLASFFEYHDLSYTIRGSLVREFGYCFEQAWERSGGATRLVKEPAPLDGLEVNARARVVRTGLARRDLSKVVYRAIDQAMHHVHLENPYLADPVLWCKVTRARKRGADVRIVFAEDSQSDVIDRAMKVTVNRLLKHGIRVYRHPGTTHVKAAAVDSRWAYLGTGNFDSLSFRRNHEVGIAVGSGPLIEEIEQRLFAQDLRDEWEITSPLPVNLGDYFCEAIANLFL